MKEIHETRVYYYISDTSISKKTYLIGGSGLVYHTISDEDERTRKQTYLYKEGTNLLRKEYRISVSNSGKNEKVEIVNRYIYDSKNQRIAMISVTENDSLRFIKEFEYNDRGHEISASYFDIPPSISKSMIGYAKDTTIYDYKNNKRTWKKISANGKTLVEETGRSIYNNTISQVDSLGNILSLNTGIEFRYQYDDRGNWIQKEKYMLDKTNTLKLTSITTREIVYR